MSWWSQKKLLTSNLNLLFLETAKLLLIKHSNNWRQPATLLSLSYSNSNCSSWQLQVISRHLFNHSNLKSSRRVWVKVSEWPQRSRFSKGAAIVLLQQVQVLVVVLVLEVLVVLLLLPWAAHHTTWRWWAQVPHRKQILPPTTTKSLSLYSSFSQWPQSSKQATTNYCVIIPKRAALISASQSIIYFRAARVALLS